MPANLTPKYFEVEKRLKGASDPEERLEIYQELLSIIPKHKGTEKLQALMKTKIAKLKAQQQKKSSISHKGPTYSIEKSGAGQVVLLGLPNSGKSQLLKSLTNAEPNIAEYPFSTHTPSPGMMKFENIQIQLVDTPPISPDYIDIWHLELVKNGDRVIFVLDIGQENPHDDLLTLMSKLEEKGIEFVEDPEDAHLARQIPYKNILVVLNKMDLDSDEKKMSYVKDSIGEDFIVIAISAMTQDNIEILKKRIYEYLEILRVYTKIPGKPIDTNDPYVFAVGSTLMDMAKAVHKDFAEKLKYARIWGKTKYDGQKVNRDYILEDEDVIELHI